MCYATLLWMRLATQSHSFNTHRLALVETDSAKLCFLYEKMRNMGVCCGSLSYYQYVTYLSCPHSSHNYIPRAPGSTGYRLQAAGAGEQLMGVGYSQCSRVVWRVTWAPGHSTGLSSWNNRCTSSWPLRDQLA
ncbi:hypothetical protein SFRURICE_019676 [Spodoptera frugiperda]|nr:hypothetical protein SFRURICE_019676 [Spodoptera frugiperda]